MAFVSVTRLRLRSIRFLPVFFWRAQQSAKQARTAPGNIGVELRKTAGLRFWTLTVWKNTEAMAAFRGAPPHRDVMSRLRHWCDEAAYAHWEQADDTMPPWDEAARRLRDSGKLSQLLYPSDEHRAGRINNN